MRSYRMPSYHRWLNAVGGNLLMVAMLVWAIMTWREGNADWKVHLLLVALPIILVSAVFGAHQPTSVEVDDQQITFEFLGLRHTYHWDTLGHLHVKQFFLGGQAIVQVGEFRFFSGRYWIPTKMAGHKELLAFLQAKEKQIRRR